MIHNCQGKSFFTTKAQSMHKVLRGFIYSNDIQQIVAEMQIQAL